MGNRSSIPVATPLVEPTTPSDSPIVPATPLHPTTTNDEQQPLPIGATVNGNNSTPENATNGIDLTMSTENSAYGAQETISTLVGIKFVAPEAPENDADRAKVDCVVVSDVSGSMRGEKMKLLKSTGGLLLDEFVVKDRVGLVTFDTDVKEPLVLSSMNKANKAKAEAAVGSFRAGSLTNLSGGLFAGIQQLIDANDNCDDKNDAVRTCLLMTDGDANRGLIKPEDILRVLAQMLTAGGISVHTFGYGSEHNSELLESIATTGNGSYYYVESVDDLRSAFGDCLGGVLSVVAQNLELTIEAVNGTTITKVYHKSAVAVVPGQKYTVKFADLYGEEERDVLVSVALPVASPTVETEILRSSLRYINVLAGSSAKTASSATAARPAERLTANDPRLIRNPDLELQSTRLLVVEALETARAHGDKHDLKSAQRVITDAQVHVLGVQQRMEALPAATQPAGAGTMLLAFEDDLRDCLEGLQNYDVYSNVTSKKMMNYTLGHREQRCMESATMSAPQMMCSISKPATQRRNAYRTKTKAAKVSAWFSK